MNVFDAPDFAGHEQIVLCHDAATGLRAIIAIHDTALGPAAGGCRMWPYPDPEHALADALRLSRGMSYKAALADLPLGGGKAVILGDPRRDKTPALLRAFARHVHALGGRYKAAEDVGIGVEDVHVMREETPHVAGLTQGARGSGDPSPFTARGVFAGIRAAVAHRMGRQDLSGLRVAVQGVGNVGSHLCALLHAAGAKLFVADPHGPAVRSARDRFDAEPVEPADILAADVDVLAPCALGAVIDDESLVTLRAQIVAGAANNQLAEARHGDALAARDVLFAPDYVINAGGILNVAGELAGRYDAEEATRRIDAIGDRLTRILREADATGRPPHRVADAMAEARLAAARAAR
jgi:leucine dehydrogenase